MVKVSIIFSVFLALASTTKHFSNAEVPCVNYAAAEMNPRNNTRYLEDLYRGAENMALSFIDAVLGPQHHYYDENPIIIGPGNNKINNLVLVGSNVKDGVTYIVGVGDHNINSVVINN